MTTSYRHEILPDDSLFEDVIVRIQLRHIPKERIVVLGQDPKVDRLDRQRQCFDTQSKKKKIKKTDKEELEKKRDEEAGKN